AGYPGAAASYSVSSLGTSLHTLELVLVLLPVNGDQLVLRDLDFQLLALGLRLAVGRRGYDHDFIVGGELVRPLQLDLGRGDVHDERVVGLELQGEGTLRWVPSSHNLALVGSLSTRVDNGVPVSQVAISNRGFQAGNSW